MHCGWMQRAVDAPAEQAAEAMRQAVAVAVRGGHGKVLHTLRDAGAAVSESELAAAAATAAAAGQSGDCESLLALGANPLLAALDPRQCLSVPALPQPETVGAARSVGDVVVVRPGPAELHGLAAGESATVVEVCASTETWRSESVGDVKLRRERDGQRFNDRWFPKADLAAVTKVQPPARPTHLPRMRRHVHINPCVTRGGRVV